MLVGCVELRRVSVGVTRRRRREPDVTDVMSALVTKDTEVVTLQT